MSAQRDMVMTHDNVVRKLDRMARELLEVHFQESSLVLIGVAGQGVALCEALSSRLQALSNLEVLTGTLTMHKDLPLEHELLCDVDMTTWNDKIVILVDDVLNSGRTLIHAVRFVLEGHPREVHTAVLVDRKHRSFPIRADYCGLTLSTHHNEHIAVDLSDPDHTSVHLERPAP